MAALAAMSAITTPASLLSAKQQRQSSASSFHGTPVKLAAPRSSASFKASGSTSAASPTMAFMCNPCRPAGYSSRSWAPRRGGGYYTVGTMGSQDVEKMWRQWEKAFNNDCTDRTTGAASVPVDIVETADAYKFVAEVAGLTRDDIKVTVAENVLTISGEKKPTPKEEGDSIRRAERRTGKFRREFALPKNADPNNVTAAVENGILTVTAAKKAEAKPIEVEVQ
eukprot:jgi/Chlat1/2018/Chrsp158S02307